MKKSGTETRRIGCQHKNNNNKVSPPADWAKSVFINGCDYFIRDRSLGFSFVYHITHFWLCICENLTFDSKADSVADFNRHLFTCSFFFVLVVPNLARWIINFCFLIINIDKYINIFLIIIESRKHHPATLPEAITQILKVKNPVSIWSGHFQVQTYFSV